MASDKNSNQNRKDTVINLINASVPSQFIVDELFKDFIAQKNSVPVKSDATIPKSKPLGTASIDEMSALLDHEISLIATQKTIVQPDTNPGSSSSRRKLKKKRKHETSDEKRHRHKEKKRKREREHHPMFQDIHELQDKMEESIESNQRKSVHTNRKDDETVKSESGLGLLIQYSEVNEVTEESSNKNDEVDRKNTANLSCDMGKMDKNDVEDKSYVTNIQDKSYVKDKYDKSYVKDKCDKSYGKDQEDKSYKKAKSYEKDKCFERDKSYDKDKVDKNYMNDKEDYSYVKDKEDKSYLQDKIDKNYVKKDQNVLHSKHTLNDIDNIIIIDDITPNPELVKTVKENEIEKNKRFLDIKHDNVKAEFTLPARNTSSAFDLNSIPFPVPKPKPAVNKLGNISLKISSDIAEFIASGEKIDKKGKRREEGEVSSGTDEDSSNYEEDDDDDDDDDDESKFSETGSLPDTDDGKSSKSHKKKKKNKQKKKKKKKHKNKEKENDTDKEKDRAEKKKKKDSKSRDGSSEKSKDKKKSKNRDRNRSRSRSRSDSRSRHRSNDVLDRGWDAYSYMTDFHGESSSKSSERKEHKERRKHRSRSRSPRSRSRSKSRSHKRHRSRSRSRRRSRRRSRSRSRKRHADVTNDLRLHIDKKKLRKIAIANALANLQSGNCSSAVLASLKSGGKSVEELTDFCKGLAGRERGQFSSSESSDYSHSDDDLEQPFINHPFKVREAPSIIMKIPNAKQLPNMTQTEKNVGVLRSQFPVSSGNQHRLKELEWVPVQKTLAPATVTTNITNTTAKTINNTSISSTVTSCTSTISAGATDTASATPKISSVLVDPVFPKPVALPIDIGAIVSERLQAVRKLAENPFDMQALSKMHKSQERASQWATSQYQPGQFTGSTGVQILTKQELEGTNKNNRAWLKKVFTYWSRVSR